MDRYLLELDLETMNRLERLKSNPEESNDQVINRLIDSYEDDTYLNKEEIEEIREILQGLKESRSVTPGEGKEQVVPSRETPPAPVGDPQAVKDMEAIFSGAANPGRDPELTNPGPVDTDPGDLHEIEGFDTRGRSRTPHLDSL